jgi:uridine phosphorylase
MAKIAESELILNKRGAIYHLNVRPEELAATIITVGDPGRVKAVSKHFDAVEYESEHREFITHTGRIGNKRLSVVSTGIGPDNIDIVINELDALVNIDFETRMIKSQLSHLNIIRLGTSGSLQEDIPVDSYHHGISVTCPGFYGPQGRVLRLGLTNPDLIDRLTQFSFGPHRITNFEMETSAIYGLGKLLGHQCLSISAIVANRIKKEFSKNAEAAVDTMIKKSLEIISTLQ